MSRALVHRVRRLERQAGARDLPTWPEVHAAATRRRAQAVDTLRALLQHQDPPNWDEAQASVDATLVERWCRAQETYVPPEPDSRAPLTARLTAIRARHAAAAQSGVGAPHSYRSAEVGIRFLLREHREKQDISPREGGAAIAVRRTSVAARAARTRAWRTARPAASRAAAWLSAAPASARSVPTYPRRGSPPPIWSSWSPSAPASH